MELRLADKGPTQMKPSRSSFRSAVLLGVVLLNTGCSLLFVNRPPAAEEVSGRPWAISCTSSKAAPIVDTLVTGLEATRIALAVNAPDSTYQASDQPLSRGADIGLGLSFGALFLSSAIYGYVETTQCSQLKQRSEQIAPMPAAPTPAAPVANTRAGQAPERRQ